MKVQFTEIVVRCGVCVTQTVKPMAIGQRFFDYGSEDGWVGLGDTKGYVWFCKQHIPEKVKEMIKKVEEDSIDPNSKRTPIEAEVVKLN